MTLNTVKVKVLGEDPVYLLIREVVFE